MPIDYTHEHLSSSVMRAGAPQTPINPDGGGGITNPFTEDVGGGGYQLNDLGDPTHPGDAATKQWVEANLPDVGADVENIADPSAATAEDVANTLNELLTSLRDAGIIGGPT